MNLTSHLIVVGFGIVGIILGGIIIDLIGHKGILKCKLKEIFSENPVCLEHRFIHNPVVILSMVSLSLFFSISLLLHYIMDFIKI